MIKNINIDQIRGACLLHLKTWKHSNIHVVVYTIDMRTNMYAFSDSADMIVWVKRDCCDASNANLS